MTDIYKTQPDPVELSVTPFTKHVSRFRRRLVRTAATASIFLALLATPAAQASNTGIVGSLEFPSANSDGDSAPGQVSDPGGVDINVSGAGDASPGDVYLLDSNSRRISQFTSSGAFVRAFGFDVVAAGSDNSTVNAQDTLTVKATGGSFILEFHNFGQSIGPDTAPLPYNASAAQVQAALNALPSIAGEGASVTVSGGPGDATGSSPYLITFPGNDASGRLVARDSDLFPSFNASVAEVARGGAAEVCNANPPSNDICKQGFGQTHDGRAGIVSGDQIAIDQETGDVYVANGPLSRIEEFSATGAFVRNFGQDVVASGPDNVTPANAVQTLTVTATGGDYTLEFAGQKTGELPAAAGAGEIQAALEGLSAIGSGNATVTENASGVYQIVFSGALADNPEPTISTASVPSEPLTGGTVSVANTTIGLTGAEVCGVADICQEGERAGDAGALSEPLSVAVAPVDAPNAGDVIVADSGQSRIVEYTPSGAFVRAFGFNVVAAGPDNTGTGFEECVAARGDACQAGAAGSGIGQFEGFGDVAEDSTGSIYTVGGESSGGRVQKFTPKAGSPALSPAVFGVAGAPNGSSEADAPIGIAIGPGNSVLIAKKFPAGATPSCPDGQPSVSEVRVQEFSSAGNLLETGLTCNGAIGHLFQTTGDSLEVKDIAANPTTGDVFLSTHRNVNTNLPHPQSLYILGDTGGPPTLSVNGLTPHTSGATIEATINPNGPGNGRPNPPTTSYRTEYKPASSSTWIQFGGEANLGAGSNPIPVTVHLGGLEGSEEYEVRLVATKQLGEGTVTSAPQSFATLAVPPSIDAFSSSGVTATSADLHAKVNPRGSDTSYRFEYGTTPAYGASEPLPDEDIGSAHAAQSVGVHLSGLTEGTTYHFRVVAHNAGGTTISEDQTFSFFPPTCPNAAVRQQTSTNYLPDCRAYEIVSPEDANGTLLFPGGPNTGQATSPSRFAFVGFLNAPKGDETINTIGDLYVATRTDSGWVSKYIGLPGDQAACMGGPPNAGWSHTGTYPWKIQNEVPTDPGMNRFLDFREGAPLYCISNHGVLLEISSAVAPASNEPYEWGADGSPLGRLPSTLGSVPGGTEALQCPYGAEADGEAGDSVPRCTGDVATSSDLNHFAFSSKSLSFAEGGEPAGLTEAPGSAYDNDVAAGTVKLISRLPGGEDIPQDAAYAAENPSEAEEEFIRFPAVSSDGSHILMSTATATTPVCNHSDNGALFISCKRFTDFPAHLYMSVDDAATYEIAGGRAVNYVGMTPDGSKVYFTSEEELNSEDEDSSTDLYMWSAEKAENGEQPLTDLSLGSNGAGNSDGCAATWTAKCGIAPYSDWSYSAVSGDRGGNGVSDSAIASENGDIYFYSPEQLDGDNGVAGQQNLYDYRDGSPRFVATFTPGQHCMQDGYEETETHCTEGPIARLEVSPDDTHMALVTDSRLTSYDNAGFLEMYSYTPATGAIVCDSCRPDGQAPTADVFASQDGLFMTNDGRTFFSTTDSLAPQDTDEGTDVYEFVEGRPQLITPGTGTASGAKNTGPGNYHASSYTALGERPGLVGVSANGTDVYFSTFDHLLDQDHNGTFFKFYDARSGGGFALPAPAPPCAAAEECHGAGSSAPELPTQGSAAALGGGNATAPGAKAHKKKRHKQAAKKRHKRAAAHRRGGAKR